MREVAIVLDEAEIQQAFQAVMDDDPEEALRFMRECLDKKLRHALRPHCVPVFEGNYRAGNRQAIAEVRGAPKGE